MIGGKLYISGGVMTFQNFQAGLYVYDPATNTWTRRRDMPNSGVQGVTGVINGKLYVLTGCPDDEACYPNYFPVAFYRYNPATDRWVTLPTPVGAHDPAMGGVIGGKFYVTDGWLGKLDVYDPATNQWTAKAPRQQHGVYPVRLHC